MAAKKPDDDKKTEKKTTGNKRPGTRRTPVKRKEPASKTKAANKKPERHSDGRWKEGTASPNPKGLPEKITKEWADRTAEDLPTLFKNGESLAEVCAVLYISKNSFYKACDISKAFKKAYDMGLLLSEAWWLKLGRAGSAGQVKIQPITWKFNVQNRFGWAEKVDQNQNISATVNNTFSKEEYDKAQAELDQEFSDLD